MNLCPALVGVNAPKPAWFDYKNLTAAAHFCKCAAGFLNKIIIRDHRERYRRPRIFYIPNARDVKEKAKRII